MSRLAVQNIRRHFGALRAVDGIAFELEPGEICGLVGPNGSGKTTLLNLVSGVLAPTGGKLSIDGTDTTASRAFEVSRMGVSRTFQLLRLLPTASARENVLAGLYKEAPDRRLSKAIVPIATRQRRRELLRRVDEALDRLGLLDVAATPVRELPFGLQRRVELARAVVSAPRLLLLDEPAAGTTDGDMRRIGAIVAEEGRRGCAVILVDHHLRFVMEVCPRLIVMNFGTTIYDGLGEEAVADAAVVEAYVGA